MLNLTKIFCTLYFVLFALGTHAGTNVFKEAFAAGEAAWARGDFPGAITNFAQAAQQDSDHAYRAAYNAGQAAYALQQWDLATDYFEQASRSETLGEQALAHLQQGNSRLRHAQSLTNMPNAITEALEKTNQATESYKRALRLDPQQEDARLNLEQATALRKKLEALIPPQQQPQQGQDNQQQDQQQDTEENQQQQEQQNNPQEDTSESEDQNNESQDNPSSQSDETNPASDQETQPQDSNNSDSSEDPSEENSSESPSSSEESSSEETDSSSSTESPGEPTPRNGQLTPEEAEKLLDAMRDMEEASRLKNRLRLGRPQAVDKDW